MVTYEKHSHCFQAAPNLIGITLLGDLVLASTKVSWVNTKLESYLRQLESLIETSPFHAVIQLEGHAEHIMLTEQTGCECKKLTKNDQFRILTGAISYLDLDRTKA